MGKVLKLAFGVPPSKLNCPPKSCIPSNAKIRMNKNRRNNKEMMDLIELSREMTRLRRDDQYFVTLNILRSLRALNTDSPNDPPFTADQITSNIDPDMTTQSKRLKADSKYILGPKAYIFMNISDMNRPKNTNSAQSEKKMKNN